MTSPQISPTSAPPVADVREGAALRRTGADGLGLPPVAEPARSTEQTCTRCLRPAAIKVTVNVGDRKWLFCQLCVSRGDKTTQRATDTGRASLATVLSLGLLGTALVSLAGATGNVGWVVDHLPLTPTPNGFTLFCLLLLTGGCFWRMRGAETSPHPSLEKWPADVEPLADATWPDLDPDPEEELLAIEPKWGRS